MSDFPGPRGREQVMPVHIDDKGYTYRCPLCGWAPNKWETIWDKSRPRGENIVHRNCETAQRFDWDKGPQKGEA